MDQNETKNKLLNNPIEIIDQLFSENKENLNNGTIYKQFEQIISSDDQVYKSIPLIDTINQSDLSNSKLVKIRCMIQDIFDSQFCPSYYKIKNLKTNQIRYESTKYKDYINLKEDEEVDINYNSKPFDKLVLYCIPIPCENNWVSINNNSNNISNNNVSNNNNDNNHNNKKRTFQDLNNDDNNESSEDIKKNKESLNNNNNNNINNNNNSNNKIDINKIYNYPIPIEENSIKTPFIVNVYDEDILVDDKGEPISFKINEMIEFIGIVSKFNPNKDQQQQQDQPLVNLMSTLEIEDEINQIPDSLIPQFHSITYRYINPYNNPIIFNNPFKQQSCSQQQQQQQQQQLNNSNSNNNEIREELINFISKFVIDKNLSEYLLLHILSKVYSYSSGLCIGNFSINITIPNNDNFKHLAEIIELLFSLLLVRSYRFQVTIDSLNDSSIIPFKDYDRNRLVSGLLQLPKGTHLIIDETKLSEGKIESQGLKALTAFTTLSTLQKVEYDFKYHPIEIQTDIPILTVSYGRPLIKGFCKIAIDSSILLPSLNDLKAQIFDCSLLSSFRNYIYDCKNLKFKLLNEEDQLLNDATKFIQDDFVKTRQINQNITQDTFHYWLTLARLLALSFGENYISIEKWNKMKIIEEIRNNKS